MNKLRQQSPKILPVLVALTVTLLMLSTSSFAEMFKCVDANDTQVFSDKPCGPDSKPHNVKPESYSPDNSTPYVDNQAAGGRGYTPLPDPVVISNPVDNESRHVNYHPLVVVRERPFGIINPPAKTPEHPGGGRNTGPVPKPSRPTN
jgi:hypothetical protein